jgi:hypothetical protein
MDCAEINATDYTHPMFNIRTAEDLATFVNNWRPGKPSVKLLRGKKNPFWHTITHLGALPRIPMNEGTLVNKFPNNTNTQKAVLDLIKPVENQNPSKLGGFWVWKDACYVVNNGNHVMVKITHPFINQLEGDGHYINAKRTDEEADYLFKIGALSLGIVPFDYMLMDAPQECAKATLRAGTFKTSHLLRYLTACTKYTDIFGEEFHNSVRIGDGFFNPSLLTAAVEVIAKLDNEVQFFIPSSMSIGDRNKAKLLLTSEHVTAIIMSMNMRENSPDIRTHHVLSTFLPEGVTDSWRYRVNTLHHVLEIQTTFAKETAESFDRTIREIENRRQTITTLMGEMDELHAILNSHRLHQELPYDEFQMRCLFQQEAFGSKLATEGKVSNRLHEATILSDELRIKLLEWFMHGQQITEECFAYLEQFRPRYVEQPVTHFTRADYFPDEKE